MKDIWIMVAAPGSGKSTYAKRMLEGKDRYVYLNGDSIRKELYGDENIQGDGRKVFGILGSRYKAALEDPNVDTIIIDNTSLTSKVRKDYYVDGHRFHLVFFDLPIEEVLRRNARRDRVVPEDVVRSMHSRLQFETEYEAENYDILRVTV